MMIPNLVWIGPLNSEKYHIQYRSRI